MEPCKAVLRSGSARPVGEKILKVTADEMCNVSASTECHVGGRTSTAHCDVKLPSRRAYPVSLRLFTAAAGSGQAGRAALLARSKPAGQSRCGGTYGNSVEVFLQNFGLLEHIRWLVLRTVRG